MKNFFLCKNCIYPSTKPHIEFNSEGICSGCIAYNVRPKIDWSERMRNLKKILGEHKNKNKNFYNCIVPSSGGKDSHYQVIKMLELGMNPLCITAIPDKLSELGRHNLENLKKIGVDTIEVSVDPGIRKKINKFTLETVGDISWPEHLTIFTIPVKFSVYMKIPLLIWGSQQKTKMVGQ